MQALDLAAGCLLAGEQLGQLPSVVRVVDCLLGQGLNALQVDLAGCFGQSLLLLCREQLAFFQFERVDLGGVQSEHLLEELCVRVADPGLVLGGLDFDRLPHKGAQSQARSGGGVEVEALEGGLFEKSCVREEEAAGRSESDQLNTFH